MELQRTTDWYAERRGKFTSSEIYKLMSDPLTKEAKSNGELSEGAKTYVLEKIAEDIGGFVPESDTNAMAWGEEHEKSAKTWYQFKTGCVIEEVGFIKVSEGYGGSPDSKSYDRLEGIEGTLEIKCPYNSTNHLSHCLIHSNEYFKKAHKDKYWQCISHMLVTQGMFCDFVSFDPRIDNEIGFFRYRIYADEVVSDIELLFKKVNAAIEYKTKLKIQLGLL
jgi:hypothetical protein